MQASLSPAYKMRYKHRKDFGSLNDLQAPKGSDESFLKAYWNGILYKKKHSITGKISLKITIGKRT